MRFVRTCGPGNLWEGELAEQLGVSRTPIREALRRLAGEGLVVVRPNGGAVVGSLSSSAREEVAEARASLERAAAHRAAIRIDGAALERMAEHDRQMLNLVDRGDPDSLDRLAHLNREFHEFVSETAQSPSLVTPLHSIKSVPLVRRTSRHYPPDALLRSMVSHRELVKALRSRNGPWSEAVMRAHIWAAAHTQRLDGRSADHHDGQEHPDEPVTDATVGSQEPAASRAQEPVG